MIDKEKQQEKKRAYERKCRAEAKHTYAALMKFYPLGLEDLPDEIWRDVEGSGGMYKISTYSRVKSFKWGYAKILKPCLRGTYLAVNLFFGGKRNSLNIHVLAARTFIPNPEDKPEVNHRDGNKFNCHISNLEWTTSAENTQHAFKMGLVTRAQGAENSRAKLTESQVREILRICIPGDRTFGIAALSRKFGTSESIIRRVVQGKTYKNVPRDDDGEKS